MQRRNVASLPNNRTLSIHLKGQKYPKSRGRGYKPLVQTSCYTNLSLFFPEFDSQKEKSYLGKNKTALAKNKLIHPSEKANDKTTGHTLGGNFFLSLTLVGVRRACLRALTF